MAPASLVDGAAVVRRLAARENAATEHRFSSSRVTLKRVEPGSIDKNELAGFAAMGHQVEIVVGSGMDYRAHLLAAGAPAFVPGLVSGEFDAVAAGHHDEAELLDAGDFVGLAEAVNGTIEVTATLTRPADVDFVWTASVLETAFASWVDLAATLGRCRHLVVLDAGADVVETDSLIIAGPDADVQPPGAEPAAFTFNDIGLRRAPHYRPKDGSANRPDLLDPLRKLAFGSLLLEIGVSGTVTPRAGDLGGVAVAYSANPLLTVAIEWGDLPETAEAATTAVDFSDWLHRDDEAGRHAAAWQAASSHVTGEDDLHEEVTTTLQQAELFHERSRETAVAAVVEARKAAWATAQTAADTAASEARSSARSIADRMVAAIIASLAVMITNQSNVLSQNVSYLVLLAVLVGVIVAGGLTFGFEYPATKGALDATLRQLRESTSNLLLPSELEKIEGGDVVSDARRTFGNARTASGVALGVAIVAIIVGVVVVAVTDDDSTDAPTDTTTTTTTTIAGTSTSTTTG